MAQLSVTLERSVIGHPRDQRETVRSLGLLRLHHTVVVADNASIRGMLQKVRHLVRFQPIEEVGAQP